jgi:hypothetical protein
VRYLKSDNHLRKCESSIFKLTVLEFAMRQETSLPSSHQGTERRPEVKETNKNNDLGAAGADSEISG